MTHVDIIFTVYTGEHCIKDIFYRHTCSNTYIQAIFQNTCMMYNNLHNYPVYVESKCINGQMNIYTTCFYTL